MSLRVGMVAQSEGKGWACAWAWLHRVKERDGLARGHGCTECGKEMEGLKCDEAQSER
jgi:hypothetical protein